MPDGPFRSKQKAGSLVGQMLHGHSMDVTAYVSGHPSEELIDAPARKVGLPSMREQGLSTPERMIKTKRAESEDLGMLFLPSRGGGFDDGPTWRILSSVPSGRSRLVRGSSRFRTAAAARL